MADLLARLVNLSALAVGHIMATTRRLQLLKLGSSNSWGSVVAVQDSRRKRWRVSRWLVWWIGDQAWLNTIECNIGLACA